jgi:hypothetical protein
VLSGFPKDGVIAMARVRSPNYPAISLPDAIERVGKVFAKEHRHPAPRDVVVKALGFGGVNGASLSALSAVVKYGLLDKTGENYRISDRAMSVLHPRSPEEKAQAVKDAAEAPQLFTDILTEYPGGLPSDDNLRAYLVRSGFAPSALPSVIQSLRDTMQLVMTNMTEHNPPPTGGGGAVQPSQQITGLRTDPPRYETTYTPASDAEPFRVTFTGSGVEIAAKITSPQVADDLIRAVEALKRLLRPLGEAKKPEWADKTFLAGELVPADGVYQAHHWGHMGGGQVDLAEGEMFPECAACAGGHVRYTTP